jgi:hypothetical protein
VAGVAVIKSPTRSKCEHQSCWALRRHREPHKAQDLLAPVFKRFTEGFDKCNSNAAGALLSAPGS